MPYYLYLCDQKISGPFSEKSEAWTSASERGLIAVIPSWEEGPPAPISPTKLQHKACIDQNSFHAPPLAFLHSE
jgi:hypothetical protein